MDHASPKSALSRRSLLHRGLLGGGAMLISTSFPALAMKGQKAPAWIRKSSQRPQFPYGVQLGDLHMDQVTLWSATDRPARILVELSRDESFRNAIQFRGPSTLDLQDFTAKIELPLPKQAERIFYRVQFQDLSDIRILSEPWTGSFSCVQRNRDIHFLWSGDTAGQGWGINPDIGGMPIYEKMLDMQPDFFIHCGDYIYADNPISSEVRMADGMIWRNLVTEEKSKVAETLQEFRGNYQYNMLDHNVRRFNQEVPQLVQWDDHETTNNWYPQEVLDDNRYTEKSVALLAARAKQAFLEYTPIATPSVAKKQIYRKFHYGPLLDVFMIDMRSYRGPNTANQQTIASEITAFLGQEQLIWLKESLKHSRSTWKIIASDMPIGLIVRDGDDAFENLANGDGPPLGRELEMAELLKFIKTENIKNIVWLTADVHYAAAHYYDPSKAQFQDFKPFWEFVSGPLHAGTFGPNELDQTFGPQLMWKSIPDNLPANRPPTEGLQFFGGVRIDHQSRNLTVCQYNANGKEIYHQILVPEP